MKSYLEFITVNGLGLDIEFEVPALDKPVQILSVNKIPSINFVPEFIDDCVFACAGFLVKKETKDEEDSDESRGN